MSNHTLNQLRKGAAVCLLLLAGIPGGADEPVTADSLPGMVSLNGDWQFAFAPGPESASTFVGFEHPGYDQAVFDTITVPSNWNMLGYEDPHWVNGTEAEGFYRKTFTVPGSAEDLRVILHFGGVWVSAEVWVNGRPLGQHDSGFTAFAFDISDEVKPGEENLLAVRVRQRLPNDLFKFDANDDWALAGIYRDVWIEFTPEHLYLAGVEVETDFDEAYRHANLNLRAFVSRDESDDYFAPSPPFEIVTTLSETSGAPVLTHRETAVIMGAHNGRDVRFSIQVREPAKWTAETPNLYDLKVELVRDGMVIHRWSDRIGFREISTAGGVFRINGQVVKLRGVNRHDLHPEAGRATRKEHWLEDIRLMKEANVNAVRNAHYPPAEGFVRLCDELGLYVLNEIPLGFGGDRMGKPEFAGGMLLRVHETIQRDRNRPSVVVWDFGNEDPFTYLHLVGLRMIKGLDPTRPVLLPFRFDQDLPPEVDILAPHYWKAADYDRLVAEARRPVITTEFTHALGSRDFGEMWQRWEAITSHPAGAGGMVWLWADQGLKRPVNGRPVHDPMEDKDKYTREGGELVREMSAGEGAIYDSHGNYGTDGVVNADRSPQRDFWELKAVYAPVRIMADRLDWPKTGAQVVLPVHNGHDFTNLNALTLKWTLFADHLPVGSGTAVLDAAPRTTVPLRIPVESATARDGRVHYLHVEAVDAGGHRLMRQSVRLGDGRVSLPEAAGGGSVLVDEEAGGARLTSGAVAYQFDRDTGQLAEIRVDGVPVAGRAGFIAWRPSTYSERNRYDRRENAPDWNTFLQDLVPVCEAFRVIEEAEEPRIETRVRYRHDENNEVVVDFRYTVRADGSLTVAFEALVDIELPEIPELGIVLEPVAGLDRLTWLGQGPLESVPGKTAATCFGWWAGAPGSELAHGTKSGLEWACLDYHDGRQLYFSGQRGVRLEEADTGGLSFRILTHLGGAWTKNGPPETTEWHLAIPGDGTSFAGDFRIIPTRR